MVPVAFFVVTHLSRSTGRWTGVPWCTLRPSIGPFGLLEGFRKYKSLEVEKSNKQAQLAKNSKDH